MRLLVQRVKKANVDVNEKTVGNIDLGYMVLVGIGQNDTTKEADYLVNKLLNLRVFEDENGKMNLNIKDVKGELLLISQFTLYADTTSGNRPSFINAAKPDKANELYEYFCKKCAENVPVKKGVFGAHMEVTLQNSGPVTILLER